MAFKDRLYSKPVIGTALRVQDRYKEDAGDQFAASIGFFGFLSLFPLIALAVAVGGFVVRNTPGADVDIVSAINDALPGLGGGPDSLSGLVQTVADNAGTIGGISLLLVLLSGLRVVNSAMTATSRFFRAELPTGVKLKLRQLGALALLGSLALLGAVASGMAGIDFSFVPDVVTVIVSTTVTLLFDILLFLVAYRILATVDGPPWRDLLPGAVLAGAGWTALKIFGATFLASKAASSEALYGVFGGIIALLALFYLAGRLYVYGAQLSALRIDRRDEGLDETPPRPPASSAAGLLTGTASDAEPAAATVGSRERHPAAPADPGPDGSSQTISAGTQARRAELDRERDTGNHVRHAVAFSLAVGAVGGLVAAMRPWETDEDE